MLVAGGAGAASGSADAYRGVCGGSHLPTAPEGLPAAVMIRTNCGFFRVERSRHVAQLDETQAREEDAPAVAPRSEAIVIYSPDTGVKTVYLIESGGHSPKPVYSHQTGLGLWFGLCEETPLRWRGTWALYASSEGHLVAIESRTGRLVDLTALFARLPGGRTKVKGKVTAIANWT